MEGAGVGSSQERTRTAITSSLKMKLKTQMADFQDLRSKLQAEYKEVVERRYFAVTGQEVGGSSHRLRTGTRDKP